MLDKLKLYVTIKDYKSNLYISFTFKILRGHYTHIFVVSVLQMRYIPNLDSAAETTNGCVVSS